MDIVSKLRVPETGPPLRKNFWSLAAETLGLKSRLFLRLPILAQSQKSDMLVLVY